MKHTHEAHCCEHYYFFFPGILVGFGIAPRYRYGLMARKTEAYNRVSNVYIDSRCKGIFGVPIQILCVFETYAPFDMCVYPSNGRVSRQRKITRIIQYDKNEEDTRTHTNTRKMVYIRHMHTQTREIE